MMANQVAKVRRDTISACMTCPLCKKLLREATTISECLHTFCRKCIFDMISDEEIECCPVCNIDLGCVPLEKLRPDHNLQDLRAKIFPLKRKNVKRHEVMEVALPIRRKERSLSSLVVSTPKVSTYATTTGRRTIASERNATNSRGPKSIDKRVKKEEDSTDDHQESSSSPERPSKFTQTKRKSFSPAEPSQQIHNKEAEISPEHVEGKLDLWKPLNCLVEVANRTKSFKSNSHRVDAKIEPPRVTEGEAQVVKSKHKERKRKLKVEDEKNSPPDPGTSEIERPKKLRRVRRKTETAFAESGISLQFVLDNSSAEHRRHATPIWLCLIASEEQEGDMPLPQIPAKYLRIKDGNLPVSFIQKYLMTKLDLRSESEVEIRCLGQPVIPALTLHSLVDLWLQTAATSQRFPAAIGSSAKEFIMMLAYARKVVS